MCTWQFNAYICLYLVYTTAQQRVFSMPSYFPPPCRPLFLFAGCPSSCSFASAYKRDCTSCTPLLGYISARANLIVPLLPIFSVLTTDHFLLFSSAFVFACYAASLLVFVFERYTVARSPSPAFSCWHRNDLPSLTEHLQAKPRTVTLHIESHLSSQQ